MLRTLARRASTNSKATLTQALLLRLNVVVLPGTKVVLAQSEYTDKLMNEAIQAKLPLATFLSAKAIDGDVRHIGSLVSLQKKERELVAEASMRGSVVELMERKNHELTVRKLRAPVEKPLEHSQALLALNSLIRHMNKLSRMNLSRFENNIRSSTTLSEFFYALPYMAESDVDEKKVTKELQLMVHKAAMLLPYCADGFDFTFLQSVLEAQRLAEKIALVKKFYTDIFAAVNTKHLSIAKATDALQMKTGTEVRKLAIKMLQEETGTSTKNKVQEYRAHFDSVELPAKMKKLISGELDRMASMSPDSHEFDKIRNYLNQLKELPFGKYAEEHINFGEAKKSLDSSHYGMQHVKDRIAEFLAVKQLKKEDQKGSVILLLGPPGVGKSSVGKAIAAALRRPVRIISLGGCSEASFIRGHSRTYTGSKPGVFVRELQRAGVMNPVFVLDEIDKMGSNVHHGDPQSALLDALNDEQNHDFHDDYLDLGIDLSKVLFILTANSDSHMLDPLRNRLEVIEMPAYLVSEKTQIAQQYLIPDVLQRNGLGSKALMLSDQTLNGIIKHFV